ncbi:MAG: type II secretion system F family protein [Candidatus Marsarchaeota archaeon]|jgi:flagellar protein FlaJ|nr:type II secretion system F family protein [Candidatus Marsarchaeota archaeon]
MFGKKKENRVINVGGQSIELQPKPKKGVGSLFGKPKRDQPKSPAPNTQFNEQQTSSQVNAAIEMDSGMLGKAAPNPANKSNMSKWHIYLAGVAAKHKGLEEALRDQGIKGTVYAFIQRMILASLMLAMIIAIAIGTFMVHAGIALPIAGMLGFVVGFAMYFMFFNMFLNFPRHKSKGNAKNIERDILFAVRDMIISLRSGMPLFNAIVSISTGYGDASLEFSKIVQKVQLGMPLSEAIDITIDESKSNSFKRVMLQASVSIKAGADVVSSLQSIIDQLSQERVIELRRYGQRLNAIAMFYMLFGVILPSMGIAVVTILTTFISLFTVTPTVLDATLVGIAFLQIIFLQLIRSSRPVFSM